MVLRTTNKKELHAQLTNANEVFLHDLGDIYDAEYRFLEGQQEMAQKATDQKLQSVIREHIEQTRQQIQNLEQAFRGLGEESGGRRVMLPWGW